MPTYCYSDSDGEVYERFYPMGKAPKRIKVNGHWAKRDFSAESCTGGMKPAGWPLYSDAAGVHPDQCKEAYEHSRSIGIPTDFTPDGRAIFTSPSHRKRYCEAVGLYDRNGGYGDPQRVHTRDE